MAGYWSKGGLLEFIKEYRTNECLWKTKNKNYHNRFAKDLAHDKLLKILKQFEENATRDSVSRKINNIRTSFRKEYRKVVKSKRAGDAVYIPKLWYYKELNFLLDHDNDPEDGSNKGGNSEDDVDGVGAEIKYEELNFVSQWTSESSLSASDPPPLAYQSEGHKRKSSVEQETADPLGLREGLETLPLAYQSEGRKRKFPIEQETADTLQRGDRLDTHHEDQHDVFGKHVAHRLRDMNPNQVKYAQKLISDVLFEAAMESLNRSCKIVGTLDSESQNIEEL